MEKVLEVLKHVVPILKSIHDVGICHLDLNPSNIMINHKDLAIISASIIDFGLSDFTVNS